MDKLVGAIIQARMGSSRLPGKTMDTICGKPLIYYSVKRALQANCVDKVIVATTDNELDDIVEQWCIDNEIECFRGSENDVLDRYYQCSMKYNLDIIVRVTADDPFIDPEIIDDMLLNKRIHSADYVTMRLNTNTWPYGLDVEVIDRVALKTAWNLAALPYQREHVTPYIRENLDEFKMYEISIDEDLSKVRLTVDYQKDLDRSRFIMEQLIDKFDLKFSWRNVVEVYHNIRMLPRK